MVTSLAATTLLDAIFKMKPSACPLKVCKTLKMRRRTCGLTSEHGFGFIKKNKYLQGIMILWCGKSVANMSTNQLTP